MVHFTQRSLIIVPFLSIFIAYTLVTPLKCSIISQSVVLLLVLFSCALHTFISTSAHLVNFLSSFISTAVISVSLCCDGVQEPFGIFGLLASFIYAFDCCVFRAINLFCNLFIFCLFACLCYFSPAIYETYFMFRKTD